MSSQEDIILKLYRYTAVLSKKAVTAESPFLYQLKNKQGFSVTAFLLSTADIYCNLKQPWLTSITSNACRPSLILAQTCHEIGLLFCSVLLIMIRSKNVYVIILLKLYRRSCSTRPPYAYFTTARSPNCIRPPSSSLYELFSRPSSSSLPFHHSFHLPSI